MTLSTGTRVSNWVLAHHLHGAAQKPNRTIQHIWIEVRVWISVLFGALKLFRIHCDDQLWTACHNSVEANTAHQELQLTRLVMWIANWSNIETQTLAENNDADGRSSDNSSSGCERETNRKAPAADAVVSQ